MKSESVGTNILCFVSETRGKALCFEGGILHKAVKAGDSSSRNGCCL